MRKSYSILFFLLIVVVNISMTFKKNVPSISFKERLSEYGFFEGKINQQKPSLGVMFYKLNSPLFSDYAQKLRFVRLPKGSTVEYNSDSVFQFPVGTSIVKTFYYNKDDRNADNGRRLIETRVLLHEEKGWVSLPYIWNDEQTEATLEVTGGNTTVSYLDELGNKKEFEYSVPNMNQCKSCHERNGVMSPIGPSARQLNGVHDYETGNENQLSKWAHEGMLKNLPDDMKSIPQFVNYADASKSLDARARAYLDINCAHCHNKAGQAQTSGLFLDWKTTDATAYGFYKTPIAAGRGSGDLKFDIDPGKPHESILWYRMNSTDPGIMMPEVSRKLIHAEGVALISEWIKGMKN